MTYTTERLDEIDELCAREIMKWRYEGAEYFTNDYQYRWVGMNAFGLTSEKCLVDDWQPTRNISQAWELLDKVSAHNIRICGPSDSGPGVVLLLIVWLGKL